MRLCHFAALLFFLALSQVKAADQSQDPLPGPVLSDADNVVPDLSLYRTDFAEIEATARRLDQTSSVDPSAPPNEEPAATEVTAVDGEITEAGTSSERRSLESRVAVESWEPRFNKGNVVKSRGYNDYIKVFEASTSTRDASIQGTAYLTYKLVSNSTYNVNDCLAFCDSVRECRFANLYYEFNNALYDWVFSEKSNLVCAIYGDVHTAVEKTNFAGQQLKPLPEPLTSITESTGWSKEATFNPPTPEGYQHSFGPISKATDQELSLGFSTLSNYDVAACAALCSSNAPDPTIGVCQSFNIWRALVDKMPTTYICQLYAAPIDDSTATYPGSGDLQVTLSRAYNRIDSIVHGKVLLVQDWNISGAAWAIAPNFGRFIPAAIITTFANSFMFGYTGGISSISISPKVHLETIPGKQYTLQSWFYHRASPNALGIRWNGERVYFATNQPLSELYGNNGWTQLSITVTAHGDDSLEFFGGGSSSWSHLSDISLFLSV